MDYSIYLKNLERLQKELNLPNQLIINDEGECSLLSQELERLWIKISYTPDNQIVKIIFLLSHALPSDLRGLQSMMSKLIFDLIKPGEKKGKLVADPETRTLTFECKVELNEGKVDTLAQTLPLLIKEAKTWKKKLSLALKNPKESPSHQEEEILNFNY